MRKMILVVATLAALAAMPAGANAQSSTIGGAMIGAGTGAVIGGAVGAVVGGTTGAAIGANAEPRYRHARRCWINRYGERVCRYR